MSDREQDCHNNKKFNQEAIRLELNRSICNLEMESRDNLSRKNNPNEQDNENKFCRSSESAENDGKTSFGIKFHRFVFEISNFAAVADKFPRIKFNQKWSRFENGARF